MPPPHCWPRECLDCPHCAVLARNVLLLDKYVESRDVRFLSRVQRYTDFLRKYLPLSEFKAAVEAHVTDAGRRAATLELLPHVERVRVEPPVVVSPLACIRQGEGGGGGWRRGWHASARTHGRWSTPDVGHAFAGHEQWSRGSGHGFGIGRR